VLKLVDGFATLAEQKTPDGRPVTLSARFSVFAGEAAEGLQSVLARESWESTGKKTSPRLLLRWAQGGEAGVVFRTEAQDVECSEAAPARTGVLLQKQAISLAREHGVALPAALYGPVGDAVEGAAELQVAASARELMQIVDRTQPFRATAAMQRAGATELEVVPGAFARLVPHAAGEKGLCSEEAVHALLLCAPGRAEDVASYAEEQLVGGKLAPPRDGLADELCLHLAFTGVEPVCLNSMVSLFASSGKPGCPIKAPGTLVSSFDTRIMSAEDISVNFAIFVCALESLFPLHAPLSRSMHAHMERAAKYAAEAFSAPVVPVPAPAPAARPALSEFEDGYVLGSLGVNLACTRTLLGDAVVEMKTRGVRTVRIELRWSR
jgi:hypothetical protein